MVTGTSIYPSLGENEDETKNWYLLHLGIWNKIIFLKKIYIR